MDKYEGTERRRENIFMQERLAVLEERTDKITKHIDELNVEYKSSRDSIIAFSNKIPDLVKAIENLTEELKEHKKSLSEELEHNQEETREYKKECNGVESRLFIVEKKINEDTDKVKEFMQKNWRIGILGGFVGGLLGKLTPDLAKALAGILSKIFMGL